MKKYWIILKNELFRHFIVYRYFIASYAVGNFFELFSQIVIWMAIFKTTDIVSGYNYNEMLSYVVIGWIFRFLTTNYEYELMISRDISLGRLSNFIIKPIDYLKYIFSSSLGRLAIAFVIVIFQALIWIALFHDQLIVRIDLFTFAILCCMFVFSYIIKFYLAAIIGFISFWTIAVKGSSYLINVLVKILSGSYFPLDIIPKYISQTIFMFPFAYTFYYPVQIFLGRIEKAEALKALGVMFIWIFILHFCVKTLWKVGLKKYESAGI